MKILMRISSRRHLIAIAVLISASVLACSEASFQGKASGSEPADGTQDSRALPATAGKGSPLPPGTCDQGDYSQLKFPANIQKCLDEGRLYHFDTKACTNIIKAKFACDFDTIRQQIQAKNFPTVEVDEAKRNNATLIGCGQSADARTVVVQWWEGTKDERKACEYKNGSTKIVTGCYRNYPGTPPSKPSTPEEERQFVLKCMNENQQ